MGSLLVKDYWTRRKSKLPNFWDYLTACEQSCPNPPPFHFSEYTNPIGIEVEAEHWDGKAVQMGCWQIVQDGSLKDHGIEFVSVILSGPIIDYALDELAKYQKSHQLSWSHRTSIHVHVNIDTLPLVKLDYLIAYYGLFEFLFFSKVDEMRKGNSFCFPLTQSEATAVQLSHWPKYCALNLGTSLQSFNTVEFRHMHGHQDMKLMREWLFMVMNFVNFISQTSIKDLQSIMDTYLVRGHIDLSRVFGSVTMPENARELMRVTAKWAASYLKDGRQDILEANSKDDF